MLLNVLSPLNTKSIKYKMYEKYLSFFSRLAGIFGVKTFFGIPPRVKSLGPFSDGNLKQNFITSLNKLKMGVYRPLVEVA